MNLMKKQNNQFHVTILTIFPEMFPGSLAHSLAGQALKQNIWSMDVINIRDFGLTKHKNVDAPSCGGGNGLIMRADVLGPALDLALEKNPGAKIYYPSPRGYLLNQKRAKEFVHEKNIIILCGRFEGIDERIIDEYNVEQISIGNYVLSGGEVAAFAILDSVVRLVPGVLENRETLKEESFEELYQENDDLPIDKPSRDDTAIDCYETSPESRDRELRGRESEDLRANRMELIEHPLYTKPNIWRGRKVPEILLSGNHEAIKKWKKAESIRITKTRNKILRSYPE